MWSAWWYEYGIAQILHYSKRLNIVEALQLHQHMLVNVVDLVMNRIGVFLTLFAFVFVILKYIKLNIQPQINQLLDNF